MNTFDLDRELKCVGPSKSSSVVDVADAWNEAPKWLRDAAVKLLRQTKKLPGISLTARLKTGVSGCGADKNTGRKRECFWFGVLKSRSQIRISVHGNPTDPKKFFCHRKRYNSRIRFGFLDRQQLSLVSYVAEQLGESYRKIAGEP